MAISTAFPSCLIDAHLTERFGVLDERGIADEGCGVGEAQYLPEGYVPRLNGEDRSYRFIDDLRW